MIDKHVCSLELAKELKKAGWKNKTEFWYRPYFNDANGKKYGYHLVHITDDGGTGTPYETNDELCYPAPIATELLEELPKCIIQYDGKYVRFWVDYETHTERNKSLTNTLAKCWLYLKKENLI